KRRGLASKRWRLADFAVTRSPRTSRGRGRRGRAAAAVPEGPSASSAVALTGLASALLGLPVAVLASPMGPYDDPKVWALWVLMALPALGWLTGARRAGPPAAAPDALGRVVVAMALACVAWAFVATAASVAPAQSVFGTFGRGVGLLTIASTAL